MLKAVLAAAAAVAFSTAAVGVRAQCYPSRPLRFIVPFVPGGATDIMARTIAAKVNESWGQPVLVDNRAGGGGAIAAVMAAKAPPDGYTWFIGTISTLATNVAAYRKLPYDPRRDFDPVTVTAITPFFIVVHPSVPATTLAELIATAKARPGKLRALATTASKRVSALPDVPVMAEAGLPAFDANSWQGIVLPRGTPSGLTEKILAEIRRILATPEMRERLSTEGSEPGGMSPAEFRRHMEREIAKWTKVARATGVSIE